MLSIRFWDEVVYDMRKFAFLVYPSFQLLGLVSATEALRVANSICETPVYDWKFVHDGEPQVASSAGMTINATCNITDLNDFDVLIITASFRHGDHSGARTDAILRRFARLGKTLGSFESGIYHLAKSGVMDGHRAAAHFHNLPLFQQLFPLVDFTRRAYTCESRRMTAAGGTACLDLMLQVIESDLGPVMAARVSALISHPIRRRDELLQDGLLTAQSLGQHPIVRAACRMMEDCIGVDAPDAEKIADKVGVSRRHLDRMFMTSFNCTMAKYYLQIRLARARKLIKSTQMELGEIGTISGFASYSHFLDQYRRQYGVSPSQDRNLPNLTIQNPTRISPASDLHPYQQGLDPQRMV